MKLEPLFGSWGWPLVVIALVTLTMIQLWSGRRILRTDAAPGARPAWARRTALAVVTVLIMTGPSVPVTRTRPVSNLEIYFVVDRTGSMAAEDWAGGPGNGGGTRLDGVREDMTAIRDAFPAARFSIISLDSSAARELPLTSDLDAVNSWINSLQQEVTERSSGSSLERALPQLSLDLKVSVENNPDDTRIVYILSDGEPTDDGAGAAQARDANASWQQLGSVVDGGAVLGYGTPEGGRMREFGVGQSAAPGAEPPYITDPGTGEPAVSVPDTEELKSVASGLGVRYIQRTGGSQDAPTSDFTDIGVSEVVSDGRERSNRSTYLTWPLGVAAALLLIWELEALAGADRAAARVGRSMNSAGGPRRPGAPGPSAGGSR